jgi:hypothetical protein
MEWVVFMCVRKRVVEQVNILPETFPGEDVRQKVFHSEVGGVA